jgi:hypothetical protein
MAILIALAAVLQTHLGDLYELIHVQNMLKAPGLDFPVKMANGLKGDAIAIVLSIIGLWLIKLNFMLLFYRLGNKLRSYLILWWVALVLVVGCGVVNIALIPYDCMLGSILHITMECAKESRVNNIYTVYIATVVVDVLSDVLGTSPQLLKQSRAMLTQSIVIIFPIIIVWNTRLGWRQKFLLSGVFLLVGFTIGVTIVRGSIFGGVYKAVKQSDRQVIDSAWMLFWWYIEFIVSFVIACFVSFRSLWSSREEAAKIRRYEEAEKQRVLIACQENSGPSAGNSARNKWQKFGDDLLTTFSELEGASLFTKDSRRLHLQSHLATMDVDFSTWPSDGGHKVSEDSKEASLRHGEV